MNHTDAVSRPNVIWIFGDQHRAQALSMMEDPNIQTPNIDCLAVSSRTGIAGSPLCSPFRGSLLTSQYPRARYGVTVRDTDSGNYLWTERLPTGLRREMARGWCRSSIS